MVGAPVVTAAVDPVGVTLAVALGAPEEGSDVLPAAVVLVVLVAVVGEGGGRPGGGRAGASSAWGRWTAAWRGRAAARRLWAESERL